MKATIPEIGQDPDHPRIIRRPDGFYWLDEETAYEPGEPAEGGAPRIEKH